MLDTIGTLGAATGTGTGGSGWSRDLPRAAGGGTGRGRPARPPVPALVLEWTDPPFTPGHWVPDMVSAGRRAARARVARRALGAHDWDAVAAAGPRWWSRAPCGFGLDDSARLAREVRAAGVLPGVPLWAVDANASFARPGPRLVDGVEALAAILHPDGAACHSTPPWRAGSASARL